MSSAMERGMGIMLKAKAIESLRDKAYYQYGIPADHAALLAQYYYCHELTSEFLRVILANDLAGALRHINHRDYMLLPKYVEFLVSNLPEGSWGSYRTVHMWLSLGHKEKT
jgi:hypothetical protein